MLLVLAFVAGACGDDDATTTQATTAATAAPTATEAPSSTTTAVPAPTSTTAAATTTGAPVLTPEQVIADNMIPLPPNTELVSVEEMEGGLVVGANVDSPPPPGYATLLTDAGWEVLDVRFGSEATIAVQLELCLIAFANYESSTAPGYWFLFWVVTGVTREDCVSLGDTIIAALAGMGPPLG